MRNLKLKKITKLKFLVGIAVLVIAPTMMKTVAFLSDRKTTCIFDALGFKCMGCNILGALYKLGQGELRGAFRLNPLVYAWIGLAAALIISESYTLVRRLVDTKYKQDSLLEKILKQMFKGISL